MDDSLHVTAISEPGLTLSSHTSEPDVTNPVCQHWDNGLTTGHAGIDRDHRMMLALVDDYQRAVESAQAHHRVAQVLCDLATYAAGHFEREELVMRRLRYPEADTHRAEHDGFLASLGDLVDAYESGHPDLPDVTLAFLRHWMTDHLIGWDRRLVAFINENRQQRATEHGPPGPPADA